MNEHDSSEMARLVMKVGDLTAALARCRAETLREVLDHWDRQDHRQTACFRLWLCDCINETEIAKIAKAEQVTPEPAAELDHHDWFALSAIGPEV